MADESILVTTLTDVSDPDDGVLSLREALACAIACAGNAPEAEEPIIISFSETLFDGNEADVVLQSPMSISAGGLHGRTLILSAPEGKSISILLPQSTEAWCDTNGNDVELANVTVTSAAAQPLLASAMTNVDHIYVNPDYTDKELDDAHYHTIGAAVTAHPAYTGSITVEKTNVSTTIGALTFFGKIFGGALITGGTSTNNSALVVNVEKGESANFRFLAGGGEVKLASGEIAVITGDSMLTIGGDGTVISDFAFGGIYLVSGEASIYGSSTLLISSGTFNSIVCGGHIAGGTDTVITEQNTSSCNLTITGGVFLREVAAGSYNQAGVISGRHATDNLTITGGTFYKSIYGGNIARTQALAKATNEKTSIDMVLYSQAFVSVDSSAKSIILLNNVIAGSRYQGKIAGNAQIKFSGIAENLLFSTQSLIVGDSEAATDENHLVWSGERFSPDRTLVFDDFSSSGGGAGVFAPLDILAFDQIILKGNSHVGLSGAGRDGAGFNLAYIRYWNFEYGSTLDWSFGSNDFYSDAMTITLGGQTVDSPWTIMNGSDSTLYRWEYMGMNSNLPVTVDGVTASWDAQKKCYVTSDYKIYREGNSLKLAALA